MTCLKCCIKLQEKVFKIPKKKKKEKRMHMLSLQKKGAKFNKPYFFFVFFYLISILVKKYNKFLRSI